MNLTKTKIMIFQKRPKCKENKHTFRAGKQVLQHTHEYTYLGLNISSTGNLRVFYMIKNTIRYQIPIQTWLKILKAIIEPIALYGPESLLHDQKYNSVPNSYSNLAKNPKSNNRTNCSIRQRDMGTSKNPRFLQMGKRRN